MVVLLQKFEISKQVFTFKLSSDVTSIAIKNAENFPYMIVSMNAIIIDKSQLSLDNLGDFKVIL